jgi:two-component system, LytTR family, response regulator
VNKIRVVLVDDEESARDVLENLLKRFCPTVELLDKCSNLESAVESIKRHKPDLVFLDIQMPNYAGFEIVRFFEQIDFSIIFVTAYDQYALRAFEIAAVDYLLKPIDIERLKSSVERVAKIGDTKEYAERFKLLGKTMESNEMESIIVLDKGFQEVVHLKDILAIEAQESYCYLHTVSGRKYTVSRNLKHFERLLADSPLFFRTHKSWIIQKTHILNYSKSLCSINMVHDITAKLSKYKMAEFEAFLVS